MRIKCCGKFTLKITNIIHSQYVYNVYTENALLQYKSPDTVPQRCEIFFGFH